MANRARKGPVPMTAELWALVGCTRESFETVLLGIGFRRLDTERGPAFVPAPLRRKNQRRPRPGPRVEHSPFAALSKLRQRK